MQLKFDKTKNKSSEKIIYQTDKASTETSAFFKYPAKRIKAMKYHISKLHPPTHKKMKMKGSQLIYSLSTPVSPGRKKGNCD